MLHFCSFAVNEKMLVNIESFNGKLRDELLNREIFTTLTEARVLIAD
jgi:hypothetical protein